MEPLGIVLLSIFGGVALFIAIWLLVTGLIRMMAGMSRKLNVETGMLLRESAWGSGYVNGVRARNCLRVAEYEKGWIVRIAWIFGNGKLWLPKSRVIISEPQSGGVFSQEYRTIVCGDDEVRLSGSLAELFNESYSYNPAPAVLPLV